MIGVIIQIALNTYREASRSKVFYALFAFAALVVGVSALFGTVTIGDQILVIRSFGLSCASLFTVVYAVIAGSVLLYKELARKTVYNILAKPVSRASFVLGKFCGLYYTACMMAALMGLGLVLFLSLFQGAFDASILQGILTSMLELMIVCAAAIFFSTIVVTPVLIGVLTFSVFLAGRSAEYLKYFSTSGSNGELHGVVEVLYRMVPHLDLLHRGDQIALGGSIDAQTLTAGVSYAVGYSALVLILAILAFERREFN